MAVTLPTVEGQGVDSFLSELRAAVAARLALLYPRIVSGEVWVRIEGDTITGTDVVAEVCGMSDVDWYFRLTYERGESGALVVGDPQPVEERTEYVPVEPGPMPVVMSAVLCEMAAVHAPAAEGLTRGRVVQLMRVGPLHDAYTGEHLLDVTDEMLAAIVAGAGTGFAVPIDFGHELYKAQAAGGGGDVALYGRIVGLEHRAGDGLYGVPEWTDAGAAKLAAAPGLLYLSPTLLGTAHDPRTGAPVGRGLHSVSLTPTPRQDSTSPVALAAQPITGAGAPTKGPLMAENKGTGAPKPDDAVTLARAEHDALVLARQERDQMKAKAEAAEATAVTLAARVEAIEAERAAEKLAAEVANEVKAAESKGHIVPADLRGKLLAMPADVRALVLGATAKRPTTTVGHSAVVDVPDAHQAAIDRANAIIDNARKGVA